LSTTNPTWVNLASKNGGRRIDKRKRELNRSKGIETEKKERKMRGKNNLEQRGNEKK
jgi:hypothetical protein